MLNLSPKLYLRLLGSPSVTLAGEEVTGFTSAKVQALLFYLAVTRETHRRATLAMLLWPEVSEQKATTSLRNALANLRKLLPNHLDVDRHTVRLRPKDLWLDLQQFNILIEQTDDPILNAQQRATAISLYVGEFLAGFYVPEADPFERWAMAVRARLHQAMLGTLIYLAEWHATRLDDSASLDMLDRLLALEPGSEAAHRLKMRVLARMGQRSAAILQFDICRRYLADELGVDPEPATTALYTQLLEGANGDDAAGASSPAAPVAQISAERRSVRAPHVDPGAMPGRTSFHGRQHQLSALTTWLVDERCTLVVVSGMGGVGKTALAGELVHRLAQSSGSSAGFTRIIWRSLVNAPALTTLLDDWLRTLVSAPAERMPEDLDAKLTLLFAQLDHQRVLLVLDNVESIMATGDDIDDFRADFDPYRQLVERMAHGHHQSCLLITTREVPKAIWRLAVDYPHVCHLSLTGLAPEAGTMLLRERAVKGDPAALHTLIDHYSGNPLALKLVAATVNDLYGGDSAAFLRDGALIFDDVRSVLDQHFARLSTLARDLLIWLAVNRVPVGFDELAHDLVVAPARRELLEAIRILKRSSLLQEMGPKDPVIGIDGLEGIRLALHNVVMEYVTDRLLSTLQVELKEGQVNYFHRYTLCKASTSEYVQTVQKRLFLTPLVRWLVRDSGSNGAQQRLRRLLDHARSAPSLAMGYTGTNVIHLMLQLSSKLKNEDFSGLSLRQADLRSATLVDVNLRNVELGSTRFADSFGIVSSVAVSPDGQFLAAGAGRVVMLWWLQNLQPRTMFEGHPRDIAKVTFTPDGRHLASASYDGTIFVWNLATGKVVNQRKIGVGDLLSIAFGQAGETLAAGGYNGRIELWNWQQNEVLGTLAPDKRILCLLFAPTGELLANVGYQGEIQAWDINSQRLVYTLDNGNVTYITHPALAIGHSTLCTNQRDTMIGWDWHKREVSCELRGHNVPIDGLALSPAEDQVASAHADGTITLWDRRTGQLLRFLEGHQGSVRTLTYTPDGRYLISGGYDETVRLWETQSGLEKQRLQGHSHWVYKLSFSPNGQFLAGVALTGAVYLWHGHDLRMLYTYKGHKSASRALVFSPDSHLLATSGDDSCVILWDVHSGEQRHALRGHEGYVWAIAFDYSGDYLVSVGFDNTIRLWNVESGKLLHVIPQVGTSTMDGIAFHPHLALLAYADIDNNIHLWGIETERVIASVAMASQPKVFAYSPCGRYLACGAYDGSVTIWEITSESACVRFVEHCRLQPSAQCVWRLVFSPDGLLLAWNGEQREIYVATVTKGDVLYRIPGTHLATCIAFSADGQRLLTDGPGLDIAVQAALTGEAGTRLAGHISNLTSIATNPRSHKIASSDAAGVVKLWDESSGVALATIHLNGPYKNMDITGATGLTQGQRQSLLALGAVVVPSV